MDRNRTCFPGPASPHRSSWPGRRHQGSGDAGLRGAFPPLVAGDRHSPAGELRLGQGAAERSTPSSTSASPRAVGAQPPFRGPGRRPAGPRGSPAADADLSAPESRRRRRREETRDPREAQGRGTIKPRRGRKQDARKKLHHCTQQVAARRCGASGSALVSHPRRPSSALCPLRGESLGPLQSCTPEVRGHGTRGRLCTKRRHDRFSFSPTSPSGRYCYHGSWRGGHGFGNLRRVLQNWLQSLSSGRCLSYRLPAPARASLGGRVGVKEDKYPR